MKTRNQQRGPKRTGASRGRRPWARGGSIALLLAVTGGVALATEKEKYPGAGDAEVEAKVSEWRKAIPAAADQMCTGTADRTGTESTRDPVESTPNVPGWTPLADVREDGARQYESKRGGDTDDVGTDSYLYVKLVGLRANLFCRAILEAEDGAKSEWRVRYRGTEDLAYENGPARRGEVLEVSNRWSIGWTRRVIDFDAKVGERDEEKLIDQAFTVRCELIDGSVVGDGAKFHRAVPATASSTKSVGLKLKAGAKHGDAAAAESGVEAGFEEIDAKTYDTNFEEEVVNSAKLEGVAKVYGQAPCPSAQTWGIATDFSGDFSISDHEDVTGDFGSRQELLLTVVNEITAVKVDGCHDCGTTITPRDPSAPPKPPTDPLAPDPVAPGDPARPVTPPEPLLPRLPVVTPRDGEEPGWGPGALVPATPGGVRPLVGPDELPTAPTTPPVLPPSALPMPCPSGPPVPAIEPVPPACPQAPIGLPLPAATESVTAR